MAETLGSAVLELTTDLKTLRRDLKVSKAEIDQAVENIQANLRDVGKKLSIGLTAPLAAFGGLALKTGADFETAMNQVAAVSGATESQFQQLEAQARELGRTTEFSASQAGEAMGFLAQAGFNANDVLGAMPGTLQLASAAQLDLGTAADTVSNILSGYGLEVSELGRVNDVLVKTFTSANTNLQQLGEAMKYAGPVASAAGVGFEEAAAALGLMGNAGIQASMAGTSLRGAISKILNPTKAAQEAMAAAGLSFTDAAGRIKPLDEVVRQLEPHAEDAGLMMELFGQRAGPAMSALVSQGADALTNLQSELESSGGTAQRISDVQMQGLNGALAALKSAFEGLQIAIAQSGLLEWATKFVHVITGVISAMAEAHPAILGVGTALAGLAAAAGPVLFVLPTMVTGFGLVKGAIIAYSGVTATATIATHALNAAIKLLLGPVGWVTAGIGLLVGGFFAYRAIAGDSAKETNDLVGEFKAAQAEQKALADRYRELSAEIKKTGDRTGELGRELGKVRGELIEAGKDVDGLQARINEAAEAEGDLAAKLKESSREYEAFGKQVRHLESNLQAMGGESEAISKDLEEVRKEQAKAGKEAKRYALLLRNSTKRTKKLSDGTQALVKKTLGLKSAAEDSAEAVESATEEIEDLGKESGKAERELFDLAKVTARITREQEEFKRKLQAVRDEFNQRFIQSVRNAKAPIVELGRAAIAAANEIVTAMNTSAIPAFDKVKEEAKLVEQETAQAFRNLGIKTQAELTAIREQAESDFSLIKSSGEGSASAIDTAWINMLQARKAELIANGEDLNEEEQLILNDILAKQRTFKDDSAGEQGVFSQWYDSVSGIVGDLSSELVSKLFTGDLSFGGTFSEKLRTLAGSFKNVFVQEISTGISTLVNQGFNALLGALDKVIGKITGKGGVADALAGLVGGGRKAADAAADVTGAGAGAAADIASKVGPGASGGITQALGGAGGIVNMITGIGTLVSGIVGNFQMRGMNTTLDLIEKEVRFGTDYLGDQGEDSIHGNIRDMRVEMNEKLKFIFEHGINPAKVALERVLESIVPSLEEGVAAWNEMLALAAEASERDARVASETLPAIRASLEEMIDAEQEQTGVLRSILRKVGKPPVVNVSCRGGGGSVDRINQAIDLNTGGLRTRIAGASG